MHSNGTLPLDVPLDAWCDYVLKPCSDLSSASALTLVLMLCSGSGTHFQMSLLTFGVNRSKKTLSRISFSAEPPATRNKKIFPHVLSHEIYTANKNTQAGISLISKDLNIHSAN